MCIDFVLRELKELKPEDRLFVLFLIKGHRFNELITGTVKELSARHGVSDHVVTRTLKHLVDKCYLSKTSAKKRSGRPSARYSYSDLFDEKIRAYNRSDLINNRAFIDDLLPINYSSKKVKKHNSLKSANRLLLIVLLAYADEFGVVKTLSNTDLCKLTGMTIDRLQSQLTTLKEQGYICSHVSGVTGSYLFGVMKSRYFLNLLHDDYGEEIKLGAIFLLSYMPGSHHYFSNEASNIVELSRKLLQIEKSTADSLNKKVRIWKNGRLWNHEGGYCADVNPEYDEFKKIADFFNNSKWSTIDSFFQVKLDEYASFLLSHHFDDLAGKEEIISDELMAKISSEMLPPSFLKAIASGKAIAGVVISEDQKIDLFKFIFTTSVYIAQKIQSSLSSALNIPFGKIKFSILPANDKNFRLLAINMLREDNQRNNKYYEFKEILVPKKQESNGYKAKFRFSYEGEKHEINDDKKYLYGLLTKPKNKTE